MVDSIQNTSLSNLIRMPGSSAAGNATATKNNQQTTSQTEITTVQNSGSSQNTQSVARISTAAASGPSADLPRGSLVDITV